ncbi:alpha/beta hydrolase [Rhodococcus sp. B10]|uniref:alpha/beta fold hydrolase n=1 Tax=Rhodococcus sp. B10 TaxID=2695876 RepID=UPI00143211B8|nr:alpha/beta hydrolase [Rhodococcus sp. B10]NIL77338.1 2-succinyl-6-hydroxy-2,4-cyclohexadiene-1-carboxylate synthase [Rhodococcus sp. B10]
MVELNKLVQFDLSLVVDGVGIDVSGMHRPGDGDPIVFLHGFGSTKEDYADVIQQAQLSDRPVLAYDAPGFGRSSCEHPDRLSIPFLVSTALAVLDSQGIDIFHAVGHSMGGLTLLMLASDHPGRMLSFVDIEGNLAPEDCFLSRQIVEGNSDPAAFLEEFIARAWNSRFYSSALYSASLEYKVRSSSVRGIFESMVDLSDHADLMSRFLGLQIPTMFMFGTQNSGLSYLRHLSINGVELAEIPLSGHFPMYSNPTEMWRRITDFVTTWSVGRTRGLA